MYLSFQVFFSYMKFNRELRSSSLNLESYEQLDILFLKQGDIAGFISADTLIKQSYFRSNEEKPFT